MLLLETSFYSIIVLFALVAGIPSSVTHFSLTIVSKVKGEQKSHWMGERLGVCDVFPMGPMYGIFTYIYHSLPLNTTKCR